MHHLCLGEYSRKINIDEFCVEINIDVSFINDRKIRIVMEPIVRVIIPTYNRAHLICDAIRSVLNQTFQRFEIIVVDDGSNDDTSAVVSKFAENDTRIKYLYQENQGAGSARNNGIHQDNSPKYIAFLDSDDTWYPHHLEAAVNFLDMRPELLLVFARMDIIDNIGQYTKARGLQPHSINLETILPTARGCDLPRAYVLDICACRHAQICDELEILTPTVVVRTDMVSVPLWFDPELIVLEDVDFFLRMSNSPFGFLDEIHASYRHFGDNLTGLRDLKSPEMLKHQVSVLVLEEKKLKLAINKEEQLIVRRKIADTSYLIGQCMSEQKKKWSDIVRIYIKSLRNQFSFMTIKSLAAVFIPEILKKYLK